MVAVRASDADAVLRRIEPQVLAILVYGPDSGLVAERTRTAAAGIADPNDPFQLVKIDGEVIASDPARLADEAGTRALFGGRRAIWVRPTERNIAPAVDLLLRSSTNDALVVIEAGDLSKSSPLRVLCERAPRALAIPCYADTERDIAQLIDRRLGDAGLAIDRDTRAALLASLGGDRLATRAELDKLILYAQGRLEVTIDDIGAILSDVSSLALDSLIDAAFGAEMRMIDDVFRRLMAEGTQPAVILGGALRHGLALLTARLEVEAGRAVPAVVEGWRGLYFRRKAAVEGQLKAWPAASLHRAIQRLQSAILETRRAPDMAEVVACRALMELGEGRRLQTRTSPNRRERW